uniref:Uncharacterized protein n=1 Tax=Spumella elongata TaxID=89044 RepID=A0A7S3GP31_9STRA|mmetsp:Transcript_12053/g.21169  ORF Transcript_12053/g.21169 Transcript_12053/m.21169 type:complete len:115 (+) Transcript_12053:95-439(+)|eukprot:CAMPEP_0184987000 /NCGR_PEP_ID=MMETSP1098-20130426/18510_1 /TAXON_ID=89044 /ORGANISM="Spumella elongata, Strain CCAP 955/1" /LENGTH=114 /DNA_ID=CAMNT_0027511407 /DNA_START=95 /DNA_END=439 /DNA_ORIENTATION=+
MSSNTETEAHKIGREAGEAVAGAVEAVQDAAAPKPKTTSEIIYDGVTDTANQLMDATQQAYDQVKEAINPTPPPKTTGEKIGEAIDDATTKAGECIDGAKEAIAKATAPENKEV